MNENLKIAGRITLSSIVKWILIVFLGGLVTLITFLIAYFGNIDLLEGETQKFSSFFYGLLSENLPAFFLVYGAPLFMIGYLFLGYKVSIQNIIYRLFKSQAGDYVMTSIVSAAEKITTNNSWHTELINKAILKARVLKEVQNDPQTSSVKRRIIKYGFKKVDLEDVDLEDENLNLSALLSEKFRHVFTEMVKPSLFLFWILILIQITLLIASWMVR